MLLPYLYRVRECCSRSWTLQSIPQLASYPQADQLDGIIAPRFGQRVESVLGVYNPSRLWCRCSTTWLFWVIDGKINMLCIEITRYDSGLRVSSSMKFQGRGCSPLCDELSYCSVWVEAITPRCGSKLRCVPWWYAPRWRFMSSSPLAEIPDSSLMDRGW